jgi:DNA-binding helix-hairpin-helix protein with protein kinase domain
MGQFFSKGQKISSPSGTEYKIEDYIGGGGQGEVYRVSSGGKEWALKWYLPEQATDEQRHSLETIVLKGSPTEKFLWPLEVVTAPGIGSFGYIMPLASKKFKKMEKWMMGKKGGIKTSFYTLSTVGFNLADSFYHLHINGLAYRDISFGNVFFDPVGGDVVLLDNDNVSVNKTKTASTLLGTMRFMAPEIVRLESSPSTETDRFSLAVLLFYIFFKSHPLEGKRESAIAIFDELAMKKIYGFEPIFIFDPKNKSNAPDPLIHKNALVYWNIYPQFFKDLFTRAFTEGIQNPMQGRVVESEWRSAFMRLRDSIIYCPHCGSENFYDAESLQKTGGSLPKCWDCNTDIMLPMRLKIGNLVIMLNYNTRLYPYHLDPLVYDLYKPVAEINRSPSNPNMWGLKNLSDKQWGVKRPDGSAAEVPPGKSVALGNGIKISFGSVEGELRL